MTTALICLGAMLAILIIMAVTGFDDMCCRAKADQTHVARFRSDDELTETLTEMLERELAEYGAPEGSDGRH